MTTPNPVNGRAVFRLPSQTGLTCTDLIDSLMREPMTNSDAKNLFSSFLNHPKLIWGANNSGCEAKADLMAEIASEKGYEVSKIWVRPQGAADTFLVPLNNAETETTAWNYHVAILVKVKDGPRSEIKVMDPSLFQNPVSLNEWTERVSKYSDQTGVSLEFRETQRELFFGPDDMTNMDLRRSALAKREKILKNSANLDDPVVYEGFMMKLRGEFVDHLYTTDRQKFKKLKSLLIGNDFENWFKTPIKNNVLADKIRTRPRYFGIKTNEIKEKINLDDIYASVELKKAFWEKVGNSLNKLKKHAAKLNDNPDDAAFQFQVKWHNEDFREKWFEPFSDDIWEQFGVSLEDLPKP